MTIKSYKNEFSPEQRKWIDALKSGKYRKAKNYLMLVNKDNRPKGFCCLGVYCFISNQKWKPSTIIGDDHVFFGTKEQDSALNTTQMNKLKLRSSMGQIRFTENYHTHNSLASMNDDTSKTIKEIGIWIEKNPHLVFKNFTTK